MEQVVQYAELLETNEQVEEQLPSDTLDTDVYQPIFTLFVDDDNTNDELIDADLSINNIGPAQASYDVVDLTFEETTTNCAAVPIEDGIYKIEFRVIITGGSNSFWVRIPGAANYDPGTDPANPGWIRFNDIDDGAAWHWDEVHSNDHNNEVVKITLPAGAHTLEIVRREDGAFLDAIVISKID